VLYNGCNTRRKHGLRTKQSICIFFNICILFSIFYYFSREFVSGAANKTKPKTRPTPVRKNVKPKPVKTKAYEPKTYKTPSDLNIKKPEVKPQKIEDYKDILVAVGFSASEAKQKAKSLLKQNPDLTEQDLLREATR